MSGGVEGGSWFREGRRWCGVWLAAVVVVGLGGAPVLGAVDWVRAGVTTNGPIWGIRGGLQFALHPAGFGGREGGPRGLIRLGYPTLTNGGYDLVNFIAVEPVVGGRRGFSELERSAVDGQSGRLFEVGEGAGGLDPGVLVTNAAGVAELAVTVRVERFENGAQVRLRLLQRSDRPGELRLEVRAAPGSVPMDQCILTATMGNKARTRRLFLRDGVVSSRELFPHYRGKDFTPHRVFGLARLPRAANGDVVVAVTGDEATPGSVRPFGRPHFWDYLGTAVTQYWRKPAGEIGEELTCAVNARHVYWMSERPIPGGVAFENFELREPFRSGNSFVFGISFRAPEELIP